MRCPSRSPAARPRASASRSRCLASWQATSVCVHVWWQARKSAAAAERVTHDNNPVQRWQFNKAPKLGVATTAPSRACTWKWERSRQIRRLVRAYSLRCHEKHLPNKMGDGACGVCGTHNPNTASTAPPVHEAICLLRADTGAWGCPLRIVARPRGLVA